MNLKYNVLIIGAGKIGAFFDYPGCDKILTHAHAFSSLEQFNLIGFVDSDLNKAKKAAYVWKTNFFNSIEDVFKQNIIDVVCVAVSTESHYKVLKKLADFTIKLVFVEKPFTNDLEQALEIKKLYEEKGIAVMVNYSRRFVVEFKNLRKKIKEGFYGKFISGVGYYGKGILNNGSHIIDLLFYLVGEVVKGKYVSSIIDYNQSDPTVSSVLILDNEKKFFLQNIDCNFYTTFEIDLFFEKGRIRVIDSGFKIEEYMVRQSDVFLGYKYLFKSNEEDTRLAYSLYYATTNIYEFLLSNKNLKCNVDDAIKTLDICLSMSRSVFKNDSQKDTAFF